MLSVYYDPDNMRQQEALDMAIKALKDGEPKFHLRCLMCGGPVGSFSAQTIAQVSYTHYSYCEACLRKGLALLRAQPQSDGLFRKKEA